MTQTAPKSGEKKESKRDKFKRLTNQRLSKAIKAIDQLRNLANKSQYEFSDEDRNTLHNHLTQHVNGVNAAFVAALQGKTTTAPVQETFIK